RGRTEEIAKGLAIELDLFYLFFPRFSQALCQMMLVKRNLRIIWAERRKTSFCSFYLVKIVLPCRIMIRRLK
ncbi:hypothetical protein C655_13735, partial [Enterococcus hirae 57-09-G6]